jgi:hypothetical protein
MEAQKTPHPILVFLCTGFLLSGKIISAQDDSSKILRNF